MKQQSSKTQGHCIPSPLLAYPNIVATAAYPNIVATAAFKETSPLLAYPNIVATAAFKETSPHSRVPEEFLMPGNYHLTPNWLFITTLLAALHHLLAVSNCFCGFLVTGFLICTE